MTPRQNRKRKTLTHLLHSFDSVSKQIVKLNLKINGGTFGGLHD